jgi:mRNA interferase RelE/StbE
MAKIRLLPRAQKFVAKLPPKHARQVSQALKRLSENPLPNDSQVLHGYIGKLRVDVGEYRIIYSFDIQADLVLVPLIGKRNDDEVYKQLKRM